MKFLHKSTVTIKIMFIFYIYKINLETLVDLSEALVFLKVQLYSVV